MEKTGRLSLCHTSVLPTSGAPLGTRTRYGGDRPAQTAGLRVDPSRGSQALCRWPADLPSRAAPPKRTASSVFPFASPESRLPTPHVGPPVGAKVCSSPSLSGGDDLFVERSRLEGRRGDVDPDSLCSRLGRKAHREVLDDGDRVGPGAAPAGGTQRAVARGAAV